VADNLTEYREALAVYVSVSNELEQIATLEREIRFRRNQAWVRVQRAAHVLTPAESEVISREQFGGT
jgi:hypothetical protein